MTIEQELLSNDLFVYKAQHNVPATVLQPQFVPQASIRRVQEIAAVARQMEPVKEYWRSDKEDKLVSISDYTLDDISNAMKSYIPTEESKAELTKMCKEHNDRVLCVSDLCLTTEEKYPDPFPDFEPRKIFSGSVSPVNDVIPVVKPAKKKFSVPKSKMPYADQFLTLEGDFAIISDLHIPYHNNVVLEKWMETADEKGIKRAIIVGDLMDSGMLNVKRGASNYFGRSYQDDVMTAKKVIESLGQQFTEITILLGNHDLYFSQALRGEIKTDWAYEHFFHQFPFVKFSGYEQCRVISGNSTFRCIHGNNYSASNPLGVAQNMSAKLEESLIMGHIHHSCSGWNYAGNKQCIVMGGSHSQRRFDYVHYSPKTNPTMTNSFVILQNGWAELHDNQSEFIEE